MHLPWKNKGPLVHNPEKYKTTGQFSLNHQLLITIKPCLILGVNILYKLTFINIQIF